MCFQNKGRRVMRTLRKKIQLLGMTALATSAMALGACSTDTGSSGVGDTSCTADTDCPDDHVCDIPEGVCIPDASGNNNNGGQTNNTEPNNDAPNNGTPNQEWNSWDNDGSGNEAGDRRDGLPFDEECVFVDRADEFEPDELWSFQVDDSVPYATYDGHGGDSLFEGHAMNQVMMTPVVIDLDGPSGTMPDVIFTSFATSEQEDSWDQLVTGVLRSVQGDDGSHRWSVGYHELGEAMGIDDPAASLGFMPAGSIAAGDITGDGYPEVIAPIWDYDAIGPMGLAAVDANGEVLWVSDAVDPDDIGFWWGGPSLADLNQDGNPEIVIGSAIYNNDGQLLWDVRDTPGLESEFNTGSNYESDDGSIDDGARIGPLSVVSDLTGDGMQEIITGRAVFSHDGDLETGVEVLWEATVPAFDGTELGEGFTGVADFSGDGNPEIAVASDGMVRIHDGLNGDLLWGPVSVPDGGRLGPPTIADMTGDGAPEIGVAGSDGYFVVEVDPSTFSSPGPTAYGDVVVWDQGTQDWSSNTTGSSVFDFNGDGTASVIYNDELYLRVFDGPTGEVIFEAENPSYTALENPVIADVNNDGAANIIVASSDFECGSQIDNCSPGSAGVHVFGDADDNWVTTRQIWNQHSYSINHINDDGTIPTNPVPSYEDHNTFRLNKLTEIEPQAAPDLFPDDPEFMVSERDCLVLADIWVTNAGAIQVGAGIPVSMYAENESDQILIATAQTQAGLEPGEAELVQLDGDFDIPGDYDIVVVVDDDNGESTRNECNEDNNRLVIAEDVSCIL